MREVRLADNTGHINLALWRERANNTSLKEGGFASLTNIYNTIVLALLLVLRQPFPRYKEKWLSTQLKDQRDD